MQQDSLFPFDLPAVAGKDVTSAFDGGRLTSNAGVLLLREVEGELGIAERLAACLTDRRDPSRINSPDSLRRLRFPGASSLGAPRQRAGSGP